MNTLTVVFERRMSASIARTATVLAWHEYRDMDGLVGAEMPEHGAGALITGLAIPNRASFLFVVSLHGDAKTLHHPVLLTSPHRASYGDPARARKSLSSSTLN